MNTTRNSSSIAARRSANGNARNTRTNLFTIQQFSREPNALTVDCNPARRGPGPSESGHLEAPFVRTKPGRTQLGATGSGTQRKFPGFRLARIRLQNCHSVYAQIGTALTKYSPSY